MTRIEELVVVRAPAPRAREAVVERARMREWMAPDVTLVSRASSAASLGTGDRFALEVFGGLRFEYLVEATSDREVVFSFAGPWRGRERWSFVPDGAETVVRRCYEVDDASLVGTLAWATAGRAVVAAHLRWELARFRDRVERTPGPRAEIEPPAPPVSASAPALRVVPEPSAGGQAPGPTLPFPVDDG